MQANRPAFLFNKLKMDINKPLKKPNNIMRPVLFKKLALQIMEECPDICNSNCLNSLAVTL